MRHFLRRGVGPALSVSSLPSRVQALRARLSLVSAARATQRLTSLRADADRAEALASVALSAQPQLISAPPARSEPVPIGNQASSVRRFLDMELEA